jgi:hypothetical protein
LPEKLDGLRTHPRRRILPGSGPAQQTCRPVVRSGRWHRLLCTAGRSDTNNEQNGESERKQEGRNPSDTP